MHIDLLVQCKSDVSRHLPPRARSEIPARPSPQGQVAVHVVVLCPQRDGWCRSGRGVARRITLATRPRTASSPFLALPGIATSRRGTGLWPVGNISPQSLGWLEHCFTFSGVRGRRVWPDDEEGIHTLRQPSREVSMRPRACNEPRQWLPPNEQRYTLCVYACS